MSKAPPIVAAYQNLVSTGRLQPNVAQAALAAQLGQLQQSLLSNTSSTSPWKPTLSSLLTTSGQQETAQATKQNGIYIHGGVGTGKSRLADLFHSTLPSSASIRSRRTHFHEFMTDIHIRLHAANSKLNYSRSGSGDPLVAIGRQIQSESSVLCLDEFQVSDIADAMILKRLFGSFWAAGGIMVSTSNRHPTELYLNGLNRGLFLPFVKDLMLRCLVWRMEGDRDYRMTSSQRSRNESKEEDIERVRVWYTDSQAFEEALRAATGGEAMKQVEVKVVMNRKITVLASRPTATGHQETLPNDSQHDDSSVPPTTAAFKSIVHSTFPSLIQASLGTTDYHALCNHAHTIYLSGLRQFAVDELDFVRRFITLIDIAYESRTRIICSSTVPLTDTFKEIGVAESSAVGAMLQDATDAINGSRRARNKVMQVKGEGGSSSSMMSTFVDDGVEWSATGLKTASLATGGAGETDVRFAVGRAVSRLFEMGSVGYGEQDD